jgi:hypothetical protein
MGVPLHVSFGSHLLASEHQNHRTMPINPATA